MTMLHNKKSTYRSQRVPHVVHCRLKLTLQLFEHVARGSKHVYYTIAANVLIQQTVYLMLYIVLAYLMLFAALSNAVCLYNASFLPMISANAFYFHVLSWFIDT